MMGFKEDFKKFFNFIKKASPLLFTNPKLYIKMCQEYEWGTEFNDSISKNTENESNKESKEV